MPSAVLMAEASVDPWIPSAPIRGPRTKVSKVTQLKDDLAYALASTDLSKDELLRLANLVYKKLEP